MCLNSRIYYKSGNDAVGVADSAAVLKNNGCGLESLLAGNLDKESVHYRGGPMCTCAE